MIETPWLRAISIPDMYVQVQAHVCVDLDGTTVQLVASCLAPESAGPFTPTVYKGERSAELRITNAAGELIATCERLLPAPPDIDIDPDDEAWEAWGDDN